MKTLLFNSSLPRSGSTLIQNIFAQNPNFYCTPTSGTLELIYGARANFSNDLTFKAQDKEVMKVGFQNFCNKGLYGFYDAVTDKPVVLEKSRGWGIHYDLLQFVIGGQPKVICMVRDLKQIVASMEKKFRASPETDSGIVSHAELKNTSTPKRVDHYLATQPLGLALERLQEIFKQGLNEKIMFIRYEDLCIAPDQTLREIYNYFNLPNYEHHNFNNIAQVTVEDDSLYGVFGDHKIRSNLEKADNIPERILGVDVCSWLDNTYGWYKNLFKY